MFFEIVVDFVESIDSENAKGLSAEALILYGEPNQ